MDNCLLKKACLQDGKYSILGVLGQGGFGITYEAEQVILHRRVAIKEFYMKEYCDRDSTTSHVTLGTTDGNKAIAKKFLAKFIREAQMIAGFNNPHIIKVHDIFEENGTAYYVMDYIAGGSLSDMVKQNGPLSEQEATHYIKQVGEALEYIHSHNYLHLDVKPSNILLDSSGNVVLIDFGISKHYDETGDQTSTTPVGISKGYAPMEQYQRDNVATFSPASDIYSLGATFFFLLTGETPPEAASLYENGLTRPKGVSDGCWRQIKSAMQPRRKDRPQSVAEFRTCSKIPKDIDDKTDQEETTVILSPSSSSSSSPSSSNKMSKINVKHILIAALSFFVIWLLWPKGKPAGSAVSSSNSGNSPANTELVSTVGKETNKINNNGHDWIDLGLSVKWATCNIGASSPVAEGRFFVWGETSSRKSNGPWYNAKYSTDGTGEKFSKYNLSDHKSSLEKKDDAASVNWGGGWRIPKEAEWEELRRKCSWDWIQQGGYGGYLVTSKKNGNSIFLPAYYELHDPINDGAFGHYLSSSLVLDEPSLIRIFTIVENAGYAVEEGGRCMGFKVRPVLD